MAAPPLPATPPQQGRVPPAAVLRLFVAVALAGVGGGLPAHARRMVLARGWLTDAEFAETYTLAQLTPGPNAVNMAAMLGVRLGGTLGGLSAVLGILTPGLIAMLVVTVVTLGRPGGLPPVLNSALRGAACAGLAVLATAAIPVVKVGVGVRGGALLCALTFLAVGVLRVDLLLALVALVGAGLWVHRPRRVQP